MGGALPLPPSPSTIRALVWKENNWGDEERKKLSLSDYSTQQIKYKEPKVEKEVKEVFSFKTGEKVQEQISTMFLPPYTWYKFCDIDSKLPNTENCWIGGRDSWLWFPREAVGDGQVFAHTGQHSVHVTDLESAHNCKQGWAETIELFSEYAQHSEASSNCAHVVVVFI